MLVHVGNGIEIIVAYIHNECVRVVRVSGGPLPQPVKPGTKVLLVKKQGAMELKSGIRRLVEVVGILAASVILYPALRMIRSSCSRPTGSYRMSLSVIWRIEVLG